VPASTDTGCCGMTTDWLGDGLKACPIQF